MVVQIVPCQINSDLILIFSFVGIQKETLVSGSIIILIPLIVLIGFEIWVLFKDNWLTFWHRYPKWLEKNNLDFFSWNTLKNSDRGHSQMGSYFFPIPNANMWSLIVGIFIWLMFPSLFFFSFFSENKRNERKRLYLVSGIINCLVIVIPILMIVLTTWKHYDNRINTDWQFRCAPLPSGYAERYV